MNRRPFSLIPLVVCLLPNSCTNPQPTEPSAAASATYRPIYGSYNQIRTVET